MLISLDCQLDLANGHPWQFQSSIWNALVHKIVITVSFYDIFSTKNWMPCFVVCILLECSSGVRVLLLHRGYFWQKIIQFSLVSAMEFGNTDKTFSVASLSRCCGSINLEVRAMIFALWLQSGSFSLSFISIIVTKLFRDCLVWNWYGSYPNTSDK